MQCPFVSDDRGCSLYEYSFFLVSTVISKSTVIPIPVIHVIVSKVIFALLPVFS